MTNSSKLYQGIAELNDFVRFVSLGSLGLDASEEVNRTMYRKFYGVLVFDFLLQKHFDDGLAKEHVREAVSDLSHGFFLSCVGLYKLGKVSLRNGIENFLKFWVLAKGTPPSDKETWAWFACAKGVASEDETHKRIDQLRSADAELCNVVHSTNRDYMNLRVPFNQMFSFEADRFEQNRMLVIQCCSGILDVLFIEFEQLVWEAGPAHQDVLHESVTRKAREAVRQRREAVDG